MLSEAYDSLNETWQKHIFLHLYLVLFMGFEVESMSYDLLMLASAYFGFYQVLCTKLVHDYIDIIHI